VVFAITDWVTDVVETLGYAGVAFLVALENLFPPIPSEIVLPLAGFTAARGEENVVGMVIAATVGSMVGAWALYYLAAAIGEPRLRALVERFGRILRLDGADLDRAESWFERRGATAVLVGRCVPLIRSLVSIPAGFNRMPIVQFSIYTLVGSLVWNSALVGAGYALGDQWHKVGDVVSYLQYVVILVVLVAIGYFAWRKFGPGARRVGTDVGVDVDAEAKGQGATEAR
jgi:membrane protein DedA with SNARE-associated domain